MKWKSVQNTVYWFDWKFAQDKGLGLCQPKCNATWLCGFIPAESFVKVTKRNQREVFQIRLKEHPNTAQQTVRDHQRLTNLFWRSRRAWLIELMVDQSFWLSKVQQGEKNCESQSSSITGFSHSEVDGRIIFTRWTEVSADKRCGTGNVKAGKLWN